MGRWSRRSRLTHDWLRASVHLLLGGTFGILTVLLVAGLWSRYEEVLKAGQNRAENLALILGDHLARTVGAIDTTLVQLTLHSQRVGGPDAPAPAWQPVLDAIYSRLPGVGSLSVINDGGTITHSTFPLIVGQSRRDFFLFRQLSGDSQAGIVADALLVAQAETLTATVGQRDEANAALRASQARFQAVMDHTPLIVAVRDLAGRYVLVNRAFEHQFASSAAEALGRTPYELFDKASADYRSSVDHEVLTTNAPVQREVTIPVAAGPRTMLMVTFPLRNAAGAIELIGTIATDITDRKHSEMQLAHAQKMEAIGQLTGGVAHDFNNLLTAILLNADLLADGLAADHQLQPLARGTLEAAERGANLTQRLLAFSRRQLLEPISTDVNQLISGMEQLMRRTLGAHIAITLDLAGGLWPAMVDRGQLETAVLNLAVNARDAMPTGGRLTIETANAELDATYADMADDVGPGDYVMVAVGDTGSGMPPEVAARAFEPFFTTKDVGKGTGLGLSMVYGFVKQSGGHLKIYSEVDMGTSVKLYIPRAAAGPDTIDAATIEPSALPGGPELILLVEDEPLVRASTQVQLHSLGYRVITAVNAAEALDRIGDGVVPDLLFTDIVMPGGMNGRQLAERLQRQIPGLRVLYTSGYTHGVMATGHGDPMLPNQLLGKPFRRRDLAAKIREVLDMPEMTSA